MLKSDEKKLHATVKISKAPNTVFLEN